MESTRISYLQRRFKTFLCVLRKRIWWGLVPGVNVNIKWPTSGSYDPNDFYRPWLEEHAGKQYIAWDWDIIGPDFHNGELTVRFRIDKKEYATLLKLKWP